MEILEAFDRPMHMVSSQLAGVDPKTLATATVNRLLHHAHLVLAKGDSHQLAEALTGKGVMALN